MIISLITAMFKNNVIGRGRTVFQKWKEKRTGILLLITAF